MQNNGAWGPGTLHPLGLLGFMSEHGRSGCVRVKGDTQGALDELAPETRWGHLSEKPDLLTEGKKALLRQSNRETAYRQGEDVWLSDMRLIKALDTSREWHHVPLDDMHTGINLLTKGDEKISTEVLFLESLKSTQKWKNVTANDVLKGLVIIRKGFFERTPEEAKFLLALDRTEQMETL